MWNVQKRDHKIKQWTDLGDVADLKAAANVILKQENSNAGALFLSCYVDPVTEFISKDDAEIMSRFEYRTDDWMYLVSRKVH